MRLLLTSVARSGGPAASYSGAAQLQRAVLGCPEAWRAAVLCSAQQLEFALGSSCAQQCGLPRLAQQLQHSSCDESTDLVA